MARILTEREAAAVRTKQLEARVAELEAQLARTWQPVEDGRVKLEDMSYVELSNGGQTLGVRANWYGASVTLPPNYRFCRQTYG